MSKTYVIFVHQNVILKTKIISITIICLIIIYFFYIFKHFLYLYKFCSYIYENARFVNLFFDDVKKTRYYNINDIYNSFLKNIFENNNLFNHFTILILLSKLIHFYESVFFFVLLTISNEKFNISSLIIDNLF